MKRTLERDEDIRASQQATEGTSGFARLKIPERKTPWYILDLNYVDGHVHYVEFPDGSKRRIKCLGDDTSGGFAPDDCPICAYTLALYQKAKALRNEGMTSRADKLKKKANDMRGSYEAHFVAVRGALLMQRVNGKKVWTADFDFGEDLEDEDRAQLGILSLTAAQFNGLVEMVRDEQYPFIKGGADLGNRVLFTKKEASSRQNSSFKIVKWSAAKEQSDPPELPEGTNLEEMFDLESHFKKDEDIVNKAYDLLSGVVSSGDDAEEDEEEGVVSSADEPDEAFLDGEDDPAPPKEKKRRRSKPEPEEDEDDESEFNAKYGEDDDDFLGDMDDEEDDEPQPKRRTTRKRTV